MSPMRTIASYPDGATTSALRCACEQRLLDQHLDRLVIHHAYRWHRSAVPGRRGERIQRDIGDDPQIRQRIAE